MRARPPLRPFDFSIAPDDLVFKFESYDRSLLAQHTTDRRRVARSMGRRQRKRWALNCEKRMDRYYIARPNVIPGYGSLDGRTDGLIRLVKDHLIFDLDQRSRSWLVKIKITSKRSRSWQWSSRSKIEIKDQLLEICTEGITESNYSNYSNST